MRRAMPYTPQQNELTKTGATWRARCILYYRSIEKK
ncbi:hypothetical protein GN244_ATG19424 [Phytophthora infestans]|uniref:Uncharacterized protein n=1 Tax=Phytophthora infestans TaxID=4787 RepID=A0A833RNM2_PHYIN|nr:hypothetical protein GN244_ATG19424 [Phytophthora infestans]